MYQKNIVSTILPFFKKLGRLLTLFGRRAVRGGYQAFSTGRVALHPLNRLLHAFLTRSHSILLFGKRVVISGRRIAALAAVVLLVMVVPLIIWQFASPDDTQAAWFDGSYGYRKRIPVTNTSGSVQTDFQTELSLDTATQITAGKLQSDCDDLRFTDVSGKVLSYWLEPNTCNSATTKVFVKVPSIPTSGADIYWYYGNPNDTSTSSSQNTFTQELDSATINWPLDDTTTTQSYSRVINQGQALGRNIIVNSTFDTDTVWTKAAGVTISDGTANFAAVSNSGALRDATIQALAGPPGTVFETTFTVSNYVAGSVRILIGGGGTGTSRSADGTYTQYIVGSNSNGVFIDATGFTGSIDDVIVKRYLIPASISTATTLLTDGTMETAGVGDWTAINSATLTKETTTPYAGTQVIRVTRNGVTTPGAAQTILTSGNPYRVYGYARSDGSAAPSVRQGATVIWTGTTSTEWQLIDTVFVATATDLRLIAATNTGTQYVEFDNVVVTTIDALRAGELLLDGDMEATGTEHYSVLNATILTKETTSPHGGTQVLRTAYNGTTVGALKPIFTLGRTYRITGYVRGDGTAVPRVGDAAATTFTGTSSTSWQWFDIIRVAANAQLALYCNATTGQYCEFDDISVTEVPPLVGLPTNGVTLGTSSGTAGHGTTAYTFDGTNDMLYPASTGDANGVFNPSEGTLVVWAKYTGSWTDGTARTIARWHTDVNNSLEILKDTTNNQVTLKYIAGGTTKNVTISSFSPSTWQQYAISWNKSADTLKVFVNGTQRGTTQTGLGTWVGNVALTIGASTTAGATPWSGLINDVRFYNTALSDAEITAQYSATVDIHPYTTTNYPGKELYRTYDTRVVVGTLATEEVTPGPIAEWNFDEGQGQTVQDATANNNDGTLGANSGASTDDPTWVQEGECVSGKCLRFDGVDDMGTVPYDSSINLSNSNFTVSSWIKLNQIPSASTAILSRTTGTSGKAYALYIDSSGRFNGTIWNSVGSQGAFCTSTTLPVNAWVHVSYDYQDGYGHCYVNGVLVHTSTQFIGTRGGDASKALEIGARLSSGGWYFNGLMDEVKIYPYARSAAQIQADYNAGAAQIGNSNEATLTQGLVGYWKMDETSWTNNCSTGTVLDSSGNGYHQVSCPNATGPTGGVAGKFDKGGSFNGTSQYLKVNGATKLLITNASVSISAWVNPSSVSGSDVIAGRDNGSTLGYGLILDNGTPYAILRSSGQTVLTSCVATKPIPVNTWSHVAATYQDSEAGTIINFYVNGVLSKSCTTVGRVGGGNVFYTSAINNGTSSFFDGKLDEIRVYDRVLAQSEVAALANQGLNPTAHWQLDEGGGTSAVDSSANSYTATLTGTPAWQQGKFGNALTFSGSNYGSTAVTWPTSGSVSLWAHPTSYSDGIGPAGWKYGAADGGYILIDEGTSGTPGTWRAVFDPNRSVAEAVITGPAIVQNTWTHLSMTWTVNSTTSVYTVTLYVNGVRSGTTTWTGTPDSNIGPFYIGTTGQAVNNNFVGGVDDVKVYDYARSATQVLEDMNASHPVGGSPVGSQVSYWALDDAQGTTGNDSSINSNHLTLNTASWTLSGKTNSAWNGTGATWLSRADDSDLDFAAAEDFSLALWFKSDAATNPAATEYLIDKSLSDATQSAGYAVYAKTDGTLCFGVDDDTTWNPDDEACTTADVYDGTWHHVVARKSNTARIDIMVDGQLKGMDQTIAATNTLANARIFYLGDRDGVDNGDEFNGDLDEVKVYRTALTEEQARIDMNAGASTNFGATAATEASTLIDGAGAAPVAHLKFDDNTGTTAIDSSGNNNPGTLTNGPTWTVGKEGSAVDLDGVDDYVTLPDQAAYTPTNTGFTVMGWVKFNSFETSGAQTRSTLIAKTPIDVAASGWEWTLGTFDSSATTTPYFHFLSVTTDGNTLSHAQSTVPAIAGTWYHLVATVNTSGGASLYVNGALVATGANAGFPSNTTSPVNIGVEYGNSNRWDTDATIDSVKMYNYVRTPAQIAYDYNRGAPIAHWQLDECQGSTINDASGNGNTGTLTIGALSEDTIGTCSTSSTAWGSGATGKYNSSLSFDGSDDYVDLDARAANMPSGTTPMSVSLWVKHNSVAAAQVPFSYGGDDTNTGYWFRYSSSPQFLLNNQSVANANVTLTTGQWYHLAATYDRTNIKLYLNGNLIGTTAYNSSISSSTRLRIGTEYNRAYNMNGQVDDVRVYNHALGGDQIKKLYNQGAGARFGPSSGSP